MSFKHVADLVPDYTALPTVDEMHARTTALQALRHPLVHVQCIGESRDGEPIEMISIGRGKRQALLVGTPHPNEPIGCLTIEFLIERLLADEGLLNELDHTWHFIKTIEPDGLRLNEGWLKRPLDLAAYLESFYRPAFDEQADYTFPLEVPGYSFEKSTPENRAWQQAISLVRPDLLVSLHNAEHGGVFYIVTRSHGGLVAELAQQPVRYGQPLDEIGELFAELPALCPGVFQSFDMAALVTAGSGKFAWNAGNSSFGFTARRGTFGLAIETPYWREAEWADTGEVMTLETALAPTPQWSDAVVRLTNLYLPHLKQLAQGREIRLVRAIHEMQSQIERLRSAYPQLPKITLPASVGQTQRRAARILYLRPVAMLCRLAAAITTRRGGADPLAGAAESETREYLRSALADSALTSGMEAVPLRTSVSIQVDAILTTAMLLQQDVSQVMA